MKYLTTTVGVAAGLTAAALGLAGTASAAPAGPGSASDAINQLEELGNRVIVDRMSDTPLSQASVVSVRPGADIRNPVWDANQDTDRRQAGGQVIYIAVR